MKHWRNSCTQLIEFQLSDDFWPCAHNMRNLQLFIAHILFHFPQNLKTFASIPCRNSYCFKHISVICYQRALIFQISRRKPGNRAPVCLPNILWLKRIRVMSVNMESVPIWNFHQNYILSFIHLFPDIFHSGYYLHPCNYIFKIDKKCTKLYWKHILNVREVK